MNILVFDIETIPDVETGRKLFDLEEGDDEAVAQAMFDLRKEKTGSEFLPHFLQRVAAISIVFAGHNGDFKVMSLGEPDSSEEELIRQFFGGIEKYTPTLVSWNGSGFDLPVLHYRALKHSIRAERYWEMGREDQSFRFNNYVNRYHLRHTDLMDLLSLYNLRSAAPLDQIATMLGFPGKMGMSGAKVWDEWRSGNIGEIRNYCETDVLNTYLVYLRFQLMSGAIGFERHDIACDEIFTSLMASGYPHLVDFARAWRPNG